MLQGLTIEEHVAAGVRSGFHTHSRLFKLRLQFYPEHMYPAEANVTFAAVADCFEKLFMPRLQVQIVCAFFRSQLACAPVSGLNLLVSRFASLNLLEL